MADRFQHLIRGSGLPYPPIATEVPIRTEAPVVSGLKAGFGAQLLVLQAPPSGECCRVARRILSSGRSQIRT